MHSKQNNKLRMAQASLGCLQDEDNAALWKDITAFGEEVASLETIVDDIVACGQRQTARTGYSAQKNAAKQSLVDEAWAVCCGLQSLASKTDDTKLAAQVKFSRSTIGRGRENDFSNRCKSLLALGDENADALAAKYNVSANDLKALKNGITAFADVQPKPRQGRSASASATSELAGLFLQLDVVLNNRLDPLMEKFKFTNGAFYNEYQTARSIVDSAASHETKDAQASLPMPLPKAA